MRKKKEDILTIKCKFHCYFSVKINVSCERYNFIKAVQKEDEPYKLLKDKIVYGIRLNQVREKLLTYNK